MSQTIILSRVQHSIANIISVSPSYTNDFRNFSLYNIYGKCKSIVLDPKQEKELLLSGKVFST